MYCALAETGACVGGGGAVDVLELFEEEEDSADELSWLALSSSALLSNVSSSEDINSLFSVEFIGGRLSVSFLQESNNKVGLRKQSANTSAIKDLQFFIILSVGRLPKNLKAIIRDF